MLRTHVNDVILTQMTSGEDPHYLLISHILKYVQHVNLRRHSLAQ